LATSRRRPGSCVSASSRSARGSRSAAAAADGAAASEGEAPQPQPIDPLSWVRVRIVSEAEVNGMRFFGGTALDVKGADAERLIAAGTAELLVETAPATTAAPTPEPAAPAPAAPAGRGRAKAKS